MDIHIKNLQRKIKVPPCAHTQSLVHTVLGAHRADVLSVSCMELYISFVSLNKMVEINARVFGKHAPTDVISVPLDTEESVPLNKGGCRGLFFSAGDTPTPHKDSTPPRIFGEIFVCCDVAQQQARQYHTTLARELDLLVIHGLLHLVGYDDRTKTQRVKMRKEEQRMMRTMQKFQAED